MKNEKLIRGIIIKVERLNAMLFKFVFLFIKKSTLW